MSDDIKSSAPIWDGRPPIDSPPAYIHTTDQDQYQDQEDPPLNTAESSSSTASAPTLPRRPSRRRPTYDPLQALSALPLIAHHKYNVPTSTLSKDRLTVIISQQPQLHSQTSHLLPFILEQSRLPPRPVLRITGRHNNNATVDFNITLNLTHLIDLRSGLNWRMKSAQQSPLPSSSRQAALLANDNPAVTSSVMQIVKRFCSDRSENKSLTLTRSISGLPTEMLAGQVRNLAAAIRYRGLLAIEFTNERSQIVVRKEPSGWFSSVLRLHAEVKYEVPEAVWSFGHGVGVDGHSGEGSSELGLQIGHEWWAAWSGTIRNSMVRKHRGSVGIDDWMEWRMGQLEPDPGRDWGTDSLG